MEPTPWLEVTEIAAAGAATAAMPVAAPSQTPPEQSWFMIARLLKTASPERAAGSAETAPGSGARAAMAALSDLAATVATVEREAQAMAARLLTPPAGRTLPSIAPYPITARRVEPAATAERRAVW